VAGRGINGAAVTLAAAGAYLVYAGIRNVPLLDGLRDLFAGRLPAPRPRTPTAVSFATTVGSQAGAAAGAASGGPKTLAEALAAAVKAGYKYTLGPVKDYVATAAYEIGPKFGIKTIYGWAPGLYEHPKGRALDFMINTPGLGAPTGSALATYVVANYQRLNVYYVIWNRQVWNVTRINDGWHKYTGTNPHTDHVHVSFN
jgi:hypothetical protein